MEAHTRKIKSFFFAKKAQKVTARLSLPVTASCHPLGNLARIAVMGERVRGAGGRAAGTCPFWTVWHRSLKVVGLISGLSSNEPQITAIRFSVRSGDATYGASGEHGRGFRRDGGRRRGRHRERGGRSRLWLQKKVIC